MKRIKQLIFVSLILVFTAISASAQSHKVSGTVSSTTGESLIGAGVLIKGTSTGVVTEADGSYQLQVPDGATLEFSCIGYKTVEYMPGPKTSLNVVLEEDLRILEEAVVVGYGVQSKVTLTGSVTSTSGDDLMKNSSVNLSQGLAGRISGVIVSNRSGEPGKDDATILIRGRSTLGDNSPLIIIDGVQGRDEDFSRLTGEEIESVNVLKDVSANIYGARAANGVIIVTTKRGKFNEAPNVTFTYDLGLQSPTRIVKMADAVLYAKAYNAELAIGNRPAIFTDAQIAAYADGSDPDNYPNTDWCDEVIKKISAQHKYGVSINGGGERVAYFVQFNGQMQDGIYVNSSTNFNQYNVRSNIDIKVTKDLTLGFDLNARQQHKDYSAYGAGSDIFYTLLKLKPTGAAYYSNGLLRSGDYNPAALVSDLCGYNNTTINTTSATFKADWKLDFITKGLSVNANLAYDLIGKFNKIWQTPWTCYSYDQVTGNYNATTSKYFATPSLREAQTNTSRTSLNVNLNYDRNFGDHHVQALAGFEQYFYHMDYMQVGRDSYMTDALDQIFAGDGDKNTWRTRGYASETAQRSFFSRVNYDYKSKYMLSGILRYDASDNFSAENRWGLFPGVSLGWRVSEEPFIKDNYPWLTNLKVRASYGTQGNDKIDPYQYMTTYDFSTSTIYQSMFGGSEVSYIIPGAIPNENVTWEVAHTYNFGIDGSINNGKLGWELEAFYTHRKNILCTMNASVPFFTGMSGTLPDMNIGEVDNRGVELQLYHDNRVGDLMYHVQGNIMWAKNKIIYMDETPWGEGHEYMDLTGHPMGSSLIYQTIGINKDASDLQKYTQISGAGLGDFIYQDLDGDDKITNYDRKRTDLTSVPQIVFGLNFTATWKNFDFSMLLQGQGMVRCYYAPYSDPLSNNVNWDAAEKAWTLDNPTSDYPRLGSTVSNGGVYRVSFYHRNAAFLRLKNIELGYTIPQKVFGSIVPIKGIRCYIAGYNLFTISGLTEIDPETADGSGSSVYPQMRIMNAGVKLSF
ncbi:MAG: TonB-dependent receptor [Bacteroidales bacterium]|nr:TonB-dependent receptor [Bacteroidales bacterium]